MISKSMHQKYLLRLSLSLRRMTLLPCFQQHRTHARNCPMSFTVHFSMSPHFQILAHKVGCQKVPWNGYVDMFVGGWRGTWARSVPRSSMSEIRGVWEKCPEAQEEKKKKKSLSQPPSRQRGTLLLGISPKCSLVHDIFSNQRTSFLVNVPPGLLMREAGS